jgi:hypothetical protein
VAALARGSRGADDAALSRRAAAGDGDAFATLYERYEGRVYDLCYRLLGSHEDAAAATREAFLGVLRGGSSVLRSALEACSEAALPVEEREVLALVATGSACERALPLIALEQDGELDEDSNDAGWLGEHLMRCRGCRLRRDAVQEAQDYFRAWPPADAGALLFRETMTRAADQVGADWSKAIARHEARRSAAAPREPIRRHRRRDLTLVGVLTGVLVLVVLVGAATDDDPVESAAPAAAEEPAAAEPSVTGPPVAEPGRKARKKEGRPDRRQRRRARRRATADRGEPVSAREPKPAPAPEAAPKEKPPVRRGRVEHGRDPGGQGGLVPEVTPAPPAPPQPTETTPPPPTLPPETTPLPQ